MIAFIIIIFKIYLLFKILAIIKPFKADYLFDFNNNVFIINGGTLKYVANRQYEIKVSTTYMNVEYTQKVQITIENTSDLPVVTLE
jgi:hypothetical protein